MNLAALARPWGELRIIMAEDGRTLVAYCYRHKDKDHADDTVITLGDVSVYPDIAKKAEPA